MLPSENGSCLVRGYKVEVQVPPAIRRRRLTHMIRSSAPATTRAALRVEQLQGLRAASYNDRQFGEQVLLLLWEHSGNEED